MGGARKVWNDGEALTTPELQRAADAGANADELIYQDLVTFQTNLTAYSKTTIPLIDETMAGTVIVNPRLLATFSTSTNGAVRVWPSVHIAEVQPALTQQIPTRQLVARLTNATDAPAHSANNNVSSRIDLVYATVTRSVSVTGSRKVKSVVDGSISSQSLTLETQPTITLNIVAGTPGGGNPALPADTSTSWNFPIAFVTLPPNYVAGTQLTQSEITQAWNAGWIHPQRIQRHRPGSIMSNAYSSSGNGRATTPLWAGWGSMIEFAVVMQHKVQSATPVVIDGTIDWRRRMVEASARLFPDQAAAGGSSTAPELYTGGAFDDGTLNSYSADASTTHGSFASGPRYTGVTGGVFWLPSGNSTTGPQLDAGGTNGALRMIFNYLPYNNGFDIWWVRVRATDQFAF